MTLNGEIGKYIHDLNDQTGDDGSASRAGVTNADHNRANVRQLDATSFAIFHQSKSPLRREVVDSGQICGLLCHLEMSIKTKFTQTASLNSLRLIAICATSTATQTTNQWTGM